MSREGGPYKLRGPVKIVRCPDCLMFFPIHWHTKVTVCRFCGLPFKLAVTEKAKNFKPPRDRVIAMFASPDEALKVLEKLTAFAAHGLIIDNDEARRIVTSGA